MPLGLAFPVLVVPVLPTPSHMLSAWLALLVAVYSHYQLPCCGGITPSCPLTNTQDEADSPPHLSDADDNIAADNDADNNATDNDADINADVNADNDDTTQTMDDNVDAMQCR